MCIIFWDAYLYGCIQLFRGYCEINRPSDMKLVFLFFTSTSPLTLFDMTIYLIPLLMVGLCILLEYFIECSASNDNDFTI